MESSDEPTCRCHQNPFIGALGIQQPVILGEPQIDQRKIKVRSLKTNNIKEKNIEK